MFKYSAVAAVALLAATPAFAQDAAPLGGFHVSALAGWDHVKAAGESDDGIAFGVGAGYDFVVGTAILGVEIEAAESTTKQCESDVLVIGDEACIKAGRDLYAGVRAGTEVAPGTLAYIKGGYTNARVKATYDDGITEASLSDNGDGIRVGGGVEHRFGSNTFVKGEYRYSNYEGGFARHQVVVGLGWRF